MSDVEPSEQEPKKKKRGRTKRVETLEQTITRILQNERYAGLRERLGQEPDTVLGSEYGVSRSRIQQFRMALGVECFSSDSPRKSERKPDRETCRTKLFRYLRDLWLDQNSGSRPIEELAEKIGVRRTRISEWVSGAEGRQPSNEALVKMASLFQFEVRMNEKGIGVAPFDSDPDAVYFLREPGEPI